MMRKTCQCCRRPKASSGAKERELSKDERIPLSPRPSPNKDSAGSNSSSRANGAATVADNDSDSDEEAANGATTRRHRSRAMSKTEGLLPALKALSKIALFVSRGRQPICRRIPPATSTVFQAQQEHQ
eukprot:7390999-Prymnesium_polylepis.1